ncbi:MAG: aminotransferase class V-fold PLP-dependent enzyme [Fimbriimonadaceae bacterium]|nr:aminotransferase class V-fold PLP-dependent enzyme [Fimbriimonadaceae bacterium]
MLSRRELLTAGFAVAAFRNDTLDHVERLVAGLRSRPDFSADDEDFWFQIQQAFTLDRNFVNLNNGGCSPSPRIVQETMRRQLEISNQAPSYFMWRNLEPEVESVRARLAKAFGCGAEEIAITRNASESLETCLFGMDLKPGDEILTTVLDYPRMIETIRQRERRDGVKLVQAPMPAVPRSARELVAPLEERIGPRTRLILVSHVSFLNGQIFPVRAITDLGRKHGIPVVVDGAHAFAQFPFDRDGLGCDFYGTSLHKWLMAPIGTGFLYVRQKRIPEIWSLMASPETLKADIRKFEEIGTHPAANHNAIGEALAFHETIGAARKEARFRYLRKRWTDRLAELPNVRFATSLDPKFSCGLTTVGIEGIATADLASWLFAKHAVFVVGIGTDPVHGIRVTPNVYTTVQEIDRFADAMVTAATKGIG